MNPQRVHPTPSLPAVQGMNRLLEDKVIVVTGGSSGIGRATAQALARAGALVVITDVDREGGHAAVESIDRDGGQASFIATDVRDAQQIQRSLDQVLQRFGRLDGAFNNAGILEGTFVPLAELETATWDRVMDVNLRGLWLCMKHEIPLMLRQGGGVIVNHASVAGLYGNKLVGAAYIASKHGVVGLTRAAALEYADRNIRINAICPGIIDDTVMSQAIFGDAGERAGQVKALYPLGRAGALPEVADTVVWLFSDATSFITGHALPIDGGLLAQ
jgi:NAD(P)-dependent dehydrogenase (short-subunit alcohol dehydrogenase family)